MKVKELCEKVGITTRYWAYLLSAERNAGKNTAKAIARVMNTTDKGLFIFGTAKQRQAAWAKVAKTRKIWSKP